MSDPLPGTALGDPPALPGYPREMSHATYVGKISGLKHQKAIIRRCDTSEDIVLAQFDDQSHRVARRYAYGWYPFPTKDFE